ncbi:putative ABC transport system permease protein [Flavobacterium croceum DSM 17960]|uniref:Putative ABC transport system permease protein n=1 Tax=Flavobacterium croceum DSM 17960 TaxID=1121886 RepID=A0A2S4NAA0_9FLAO|nr:ABC transporter permease [Flavobacterium croceum]POS02612.1 putative ABC transport system permease protein [Flavobacterium croceum DSM 17960]
MIVYIRLLKESFGFAMNALRNNKLRTFLSLLGVTIGIFSIIAVLAAVDSLDRKIKKDLSSLDSKTIFIFKYPFGPSNVPRWKIEQFPEMNYEEYLYLKNNCTKTGTLSYQYFTNNQNIKNESVTASSVSIRPCTFEYADIDLLELGEGRFFNESESNTGRNCIVLGYDIADALFSGSNAMNKEVRLYGQRFTVIGVLKKVGERMVSIGPNPDNSAYIPLNKVRAMYGDSNDAFTPIIVAKPIVGATLEDAQDEITQKLRLKRGLKSSDDNNFFVNLLKGAADQIESIISSLNLMGWIIALFSLLVGGFGIANIMFVSVKERTNQIGIQKSLGAKRKFILFQFLFEAVILCLFGGLVGIFLVWIIAVILSAALDFEFVLSFGKILLGSGLAIFIGLLAGIIPAYSAAKLDPVEAIRSGM